MIKTHNLTKIFHNTQNSFTALNQINIEVAPGDITGIIGLSGAGKSTLLRILGGLDTPSAGSIMIHNHSLHNLSKKEKTDFHREVGIVFQGYHLMAQKTVAQNIALPLEIAKYSKDAINKRVSELLKLIGLEDKASNYPSQLSGGQKQRVAIARALANNPKLLLCDEPTSALDCITTKSILHFLENINKELGITIVLITHDIEVVKSICNKTIVLHNAEVVESGLTCNILNEPTHFITKKFLA